MPVVVFGYPFDPVHNQDHERKNQDGAYAYDEAGHIRSREKGAGRLRRGRRSG